MIALQNLKNLLGVGETLLRGPWSYDLGFGQWDCGTHACFFGHYLRRFNPGYIRLPYGTFPYAMELFGLTEDDAMRLFGLAGASPADDGNYPGPAAYRELASRLPFLCELIERKELEQAAAVPFIEEQRLAA